MSAVSINPIAYLKVTLHLQDAHLIKVTTALVKKTLELAEPAAKVAEVVLAGTLVVLALSTINESGVMTASFCDAISKVVFTP